MSEQPKCGDTSNGNTPNTLRQSPTLPADESGANGKRKQKRQHATADDVAATPAKFQPLDLKSLTFNPTGSSQEVSVWHATPQDFHAFVSRYIGGFGNVNTEVWPLAERLAVVNFMFGVCQSRFVAFPFKERQHLAPNVNADAVPDVNGSLPTSASEAV
jgi:hypothetical protein